MKKFLKLFFVMGAGFGLSQGLFHHNFMLALVQGVFFGLVMALSLGFLEKIALKKMGKNEVSVKQEIRFTVNFSKSGAIEKLKRAFIEMKIKITNDNDAQGILEGKTLWSWKSFGEIVTVRYVETGNQTEMFVESRPVVATTMVDYGRNLENVEKFKHLMTS